MCIRDRRERDQHTHTHTHTHSAYEGEEGGSGALVSSEALHGATLRQQTAQHLPPKVNAATQRVRGRKLTGKRGKS
eukprot:3910581-Rhodomonas_salina.1